MTADFSTKLAASAQMFVQLFAELAFLFLAISFLVALIQQKLPAETIQRLLGGKQGRGYLTAAALGAVTPFCSCSTIPMLIGLLKARAHFGAVMTFLFTSPLLNPIVIALFIPVLGWKVTLVYAVLALTTSLLAGVLLQRFGFSKHIRQELVSPAASESSCSDSACETPAVQTTCCDSAASNAQNSCCDSEQKAAASPAACCDSTKSAPAASQSCCAPAPQASCCDGESNTQRSSINYRAAARESWTLFREMLPYMLVAMLIGAWVHGFVPASFLGDVAGADNPFAIPAAAVIGVPLYIRVTALLPLVAPLVAKGVSIGAVMALVIGAGGASLPEMIMLKRLFRWPLLLAFVSVILLMAIVGGYTFNAVFA